MNYLFLAYSEDRSWPPDQEEWFAEACLASNELLQESGHLWATVDLQDSSTAVTVQVHNGRVLLTDGSLSRNVGQLVELFFIQARDLNEAIQIAAKMPQVQRGFIEVRLLAGVLEVYD